MENFLVFEMPVFRPQYKKWKKYGYTNIKEKNNLKDTLEESTGGYCMYCYARVRVDEKLYANLEHAIEKSNSDKLIECVPNIGLSCPVCNQIFKRIGERKRKIPKEDIIQYEESSKCSVKHRKQCTIPCKALRNLQQKYRFLPDAGILLQPMGIQSEYSNDLLTLQYNVIDMKFEPAKDLHTYSDRDLHLIEEHIKRFRLNDPKFRSRQLFDFVRNVIDNNGNLPKYEYNNLTVKLFCERLADRSSNEILNICKKIYMISFPKM